MLGGETFEFDVFGLQMRGMKWGKGAPILCLHGWLDNLATFQPLVNHLEAHFQLNAFDFPGHGKSDPEPGTLPYHFIDTLACVDDALDQLEIEKCHLMGHSMGGAIASLYAAVRPERVDKLILIDALGPLAADEADTYDRLSRYLKERKLYRTRRRRVFQSKEEMINVRAAVGPIPKEAARLLVERGSTSTGEGFVFSSDARVRLPTPVRMTESQISNVLQKIQSPTLFIEAQPGMKFAKSSNIPDRVRLVPQIEHQILSGGHHIHMEQPKDVAQRIIQFIKEN